MKKFISAKEYSKIKEKENEIIEKVMGNLSQSEQFSLSMALLSGKAENIIESLDKIFDKVLENEEYKEIHSQMQGAIIEQEISKTKFEETVDAFKSMEDKKALASPEELAFYDEFMNLMQEKLSYGEINFKNLTSDILLLDGLLNETNSQFESLKTYTRDTETLSMQLTSIEPITGIKHEFMVSLEEDKIYHKTTNIDGSFTQEEDYISDKKKEFEISTDNGMSI